MSMYAYERPGILEISNRTSGSAGVVATEADREMNGRCWLRRIDSDSVRTCTSSILNHWIRLDT